MVRNDIPVAQISLLTFMNRICSCRRIQFTCNQGGSTSGFLSDAELVEDSLEIIL